MAADATPSKESLAHMLAAETSTEYDDGMVFVEYEWREGCVCTSIMWAFDSDN